MPMGLLCKKLAEWDPVEMVHIDAIGYLLEAVMRTGLLLVGLMLRLLAARAMTTTALMLTDWMLTELTLVWIFGRTTKASIRSGFAGCELKDQLSMMAAESRPANLTPGRRQR